MKLEILTLPCGAYQENAYIVSAAGCEACALIDPGDDLPALRTALERTGKKAGAILLTHGHFDHTLAAEALAAETGAPVYAHEADLEMLNNAAYNAYDPAVARLPAPAHLSPQVYAETLTACGMNFEILSTPGHTKGSVCLYLPEEKALFSGDTLFQAGFGRMDLHGGSPAQMRASLKRLFALPEDVKVYPGHGPQTTIGLEKARYHL